MQVRKPSTAVSSPGAAGASPARGAGAPTAAGSASSAESTGDSGGRPSTFRRRLSSLACISSWAAFALLADEACVLVLAKLRRPAAEEGAAVEQIDPRSSSGSLPKALLAASVAFTRPFTVSSPASRWLARAEALSCAGGGGTGTSKSKDWPRRSGLEQTCTPELVRSRTRKSRPSFALGRKAHSMPGFTSAVRMGLARP
mmetsp:Transcript_21724/g.49061  ORF Transcript_21724/g.49061 Transcript_21724/m.49061 type:complete len:200 (+) Transcript_21724:295-894(+)